MDDLVSFTFMDGITLFRSVECGVVLDLFWASYPRLVFDDIEDFIDGNLSGVKCCSVLNARSRLGEKTRNTCFLKIGCP